MILLPPSHIEVRINAENEIFVARCDAFPHCLGRGGTREAALRKLGHSIALYIAKSTRVAFEHIFDSSQFTQIIMDTKSSATEQVRVYSLDPLRGALRPPAISVTAAHGGTAASESDDLFFGIPLNMN